MQKFDTVMSRPYEAVLVLLFFSVALLFTTTIDDQFTLPKLAALRICTLLLMLAWVNQFRKESVLAISKPVLFSTIAFAGWLGVSTLFSVHIPTALNGFHGRYNGLWSHLLYIMLFLMTASIPFGMEGAKRTLKFFIAALLPVSIYAIVQYCGFDPMQLPAGVRPPSFTGNSVIMGAVLGLAWPFAVYFSHTSAGKATKIAWASIAAVFFLAVILGQGRGPLMGLFVSAVIMAAFLFSLKRKITIKTLSLACLGCICTVGVLLGLIIKNDPTLSERYNPYHIMQGPSVSERITYYKTAVAMIGDHPVTGVGLDNFRTLFPRYMPIEHAKQHRDIFPTVVHSGYLQLAVAGGVPALVIYLGFIAVILRQALKSRRHSGDENDGRSILLFTLAASIAGYLVQDLSGWNEIALTPFFYIILGLTVSLSSDRNRLALSGSGRTALFVLASVGIVFLCFMGADAAKRLYAGKLFRQANTMNVIADWPSMESIIQKGLASDRDDYYYEDMAASIFTDRVEATGDADAYIKGCTILQNSYRNNPYNPNTLRLSIALETLAIKNGITKQPSKFVVTLIDEAQRTDKYDVTLIELIARLKAEENRLDEALEYLKKAKALMVDESEYYAIEGEFYQQFSHFPDAIKSYFTALSVMEKNNQYDQQWVDVKHNLAICLTAVGKAGEALKEIDGLISRYPNDAYSYALRGDIYGEMGTLKEAKESYISALKIEPDNRSAKLGLAKLGSFATQGKAPAASKAEAVRKQEMPLLHKLN
ncbi:MAG TPA: O-antigen ligase family protein [Dissulfurispiraceae bacterium]|nr:O-antigen ligase family protein [Dissulfurispiraceae bacterium]